jgi:hypothetical protein
VNVDPSANSTSVTAWAQNNMTLTPIAVDDADTLASFQKQLLRSVAVALHLPYPAVVWSSGYSDYSDPHMAAAQALIQRAARARVEGVRGYRRKLKRARRLQREVCRHRTSNVWFSMQWHNALIAARRPAMGRALWKKFAASRSAEIHFPNPVDEELRGRLLNVVIYDEVDRYPAPKPQPGYPRPTGDRIAHPEWFDDDGEFLAGDE